MTEVCEVVFDRDAPEVRFRGRVVSLTLSEYGLLELLASHAGETFSPGRIAVYRGRRMSPHLLDAHISNMRWKVEPDPTNPQFLHTRKGFGYYFGCGLNPVPPEIYLEARGVKLFLESQLVTENDVVLALTPTQYRFLRVLMLNKGKRLSRSKLCEMLGFGIGESALNTLHVHLAALRKKLHGVIIESTRQGLMVGNGGDTLPAREVKYQPEPSLILRVAGLEMDLCSHEVRHLGCLLELPPVEFQMLECFMRKPGRVICYSVLQEPLSSGYRKAVGRCVCHLRDELQRTGLSRRQIKNVRGVGYVLIGQ